MRKLIFAIFVLISATFARAYGQSQNDQTFKSKVFDDHSFQNWSHLRWDSPIDWDQEARRQRVNRTVLWAIFHDGGWGFVSQFRLYKTEAVSSPRIQEDFSNYRAELAQLPNDHLFALGFTEGEITEIRSNNSQGK